MKLWRFLYAIGIVQMINGIVTYEPWTPMYFIATLIGFVLIVMACYREDLK